MIGINLYVCFQHFLSKLPVCEFLRKAEVGDFQMPLTVQEKIFRFEIPVNYMFAVQVIERTDYFGGVEAARRSGKSSGRSQVRKEFSTGDEF